MIAQLKVDAVTKAARPDKQGNLCWGVKSGADWYNYYGDPPPKFNTTISVEVSGKNIRPPQGQQEKQTTSTPAHPNGNGSGKISFTDYLYAMCRAYQEISGWESDPQARAQMTNTAMIAISRGEVELPEAVDDQAKDPWDRG